MSSAGDILRLNKLSQVELAEEYCAGMATQGWANSNG